MSPNMQAELAAARTKAIAAGKEMALRATKQKIRVASLPASVDSQPFSREAVMDWAERNLSKDGNQSRVLVLRGDSSPYCLIGIGYWFIRYSPTSIFHKWEVYEDCWPGRNRFSE